VKKVGGWGRCCRQGVLYFGGWGGSGGLGRLQRRLARGMFVLRMWGLGAVSGERGAGDG